MTHPSLDPLTLPLSGNSLIEASAGTGKTYNIAALFTRLVLLENLPVEQILVVTFTKAATAELKTRLRSWLGEVLSLLRGERADDNPPEPVLLRLLAMARAQADDAVLTMRIQAAMNQFDGAAIYTIHGFCQRVLSDYAFLCGTPFHTEVSADDPQQWLLPAQDFWRRHISDHPHHAPLVAAAGLTPQGLIDEIGPWLARADVDFRQPENADLAAAAAAVQQHWQAVRPRMAQMAAHFWALRQAKLNGNRYREATFAPLLAALATATEQGGGWTAPDKVDKLLLLNAAALQEGSKKNQVLSQADTAPLQPLAELGRAHAALVQAQEHTLLRLKLDAAAAIRQQRAQSRSHSRQRSFDDLLSDLDHALSSANPQASALARALAAQWPVALIDECQDTDPLQYRIFKTAFAAQGRPLIMVGDPKQAIYRFRGADIHAYLQAVADTPPAQRHTLNTNHRSHATLVAGIGHLFRQKHHPFVLAGIPYTEVSAQRRHSRLSPDAPPIHIRWLHDAADSEMPNKDQLRQQAANWCADEIAAAIAAGQTGARLLEGRPLRAGDIAVLVRTHNEGDMVAGCLKQRGVPSVSLANRSVFASEEAVAMAALLSFWLQPQQGDKLRFVLAGPLFAWRAADLQALNHDEVQLNHWLQWAAQARAHWQSGQIYTALQQFAAASGLESGLLQRRQERSLTNFWQLAELLALADAPTPAATLAWLQQQIADGGSGSDDQQLRLESDAALVKIVTMHAAKGLEYPLVYCPFIWDGKDSHRQEWALLHQAQRSVLVHRTLLTETDCETLAAENMGEMLRLYYVALTRAREQLVLYAAACPQTAANPFGYLLGAEAGSSVAATAAFWQEQGKGAAATLYRRWQDCLRRAPAGVFAWHEGAPPRGHVAASSAPDTPYLARPWTPRPFAHIRHTSFTALSRQHGDTDADLRPPIDRAEANPGNSSATHDTIPETALLGWARGMQAGVCLHAILEETDFQQPAAAQAMHYRPLLSAHGFGDETLPGLLAMVDAVRHAPLWPGSTLAQIPPEQRLAEMGFVLHMQDFGLEHLRRWLAQTHIGLPENCVAAAHNLDFATVNGFINGFIDLVCQDAHGRVAVIDYKSNHLGMRLADYHPAALDAAMAEHHYYLQALIYAVAVARHLHRRQALPDTIAVRYLFVRGLHPDNDHGIWRWDINSADLSPWL